MPDWNFTGRSSSAMLGTSDLSLGHLSNTILPASGALHKPDRLPIKKEE
jgi:hypothetical protein